METELTEPKPRVSHVRVVILVVAISVVSVLVMSVIGIGAYAASLVSTIDSATRLSQVFPADDVRPAPTAKAGEKRSAQNILVVGTDAQGAASGDIKPKAARVLDTVMIVHVTQDRHGVQVVPLRRDMLFPIPGIGEGKLADAFKKGGIKLVVRTVESLIDVRLDHVAMFDIATVERLTDAMGGVTIVNPESFDAVAPKGMRFDEGPITLTGEAALAYVREVKAFSKDRNAVRLQNQVLFVHAALQRAFSGALLTNPMGLSDFLRALAQGSSVDGGLNSSYLLGLAYELRKLDVGEVDFIDYPVTKPLLIDGDWVVNPKKKDIKKIRTAFREDSLVSFSQ